jgi:hypothetical protein
MPYSQQNLDNAKAILNSNPNYLKQSFKMLSDDDILDPIEESRVNSSNVTVLMLVQWVDPLVIPTDQMIKIGEELDNEI